MGSVHLKTPIYVVFLICMPSSNNVPVLLLNQPTRTLQSDSLPSPHGFTTGLKLEAVNPNDPSSICAATVSRVAGDFFFQVEIDSMISCVDGSRPSMWCSSNSKNIFPVGWCEKNNIQLTPPPGRNEIWNFSLFFHQFMGHMLHA